MKLRIVLSLAAVLAASPAFAQYYGPRIAPNGQYYVPAPQYRAPQPLLVPNPSYNMGGPAYVPNYGAPGNPEVGGGLTGPSPYFGSPPRQPGFEQYENEN